MADQTPAAKGRRCPICKRPTEPRWRPFCSKRCADLDLGRWLDGHYVIPSDEPVSSEPETGA